MFQVRIHGRGGQGVVTATELLSVAAFEEGAFAQAFPSFGSERPAAIVGNNVGTGATPASARPTTCWKYWWWTQSRSNPSLLPDSLLTGK